MKFPFYESWSLKTRVTLSTLVIFLVSIWSLAYFGTQILRHDLQRVLGEQQLSTATTIAADINREVDFRLRLLEKVARKISPATFGNTRKLQVFMEDRLMSNALFNGGLFAVRTDGEVIANVPRATGRTGMNIREEDWLVEALQGKTVIGKPGIGKMLKVPAFTMATPILDANGDVIGVLAGVNDLTTSSNFLDDITNHHYGKTGDYLLVAAKHRLVVTSSDRNRIIQPLPPPGANKFIDRNVNGFEGNTILENSLGVEKLASIKKIPAAEWYLAVHLPTAEAFAPIRTLQHNMLAATMLLTLLAGGIIWGLLQRQLYPLLHAARQLGAYSDANIPAAPLPVVRNDEVGQLIGSFNRLFAALERRENNLVEHKSMLKLILDTVPQAIFWKDLEGRYLGCNKHFAAAAGFDDPAAIIGKTDFDLPWPQEEAEAYRADDLEVIKSNLPKPHIVEPLQQADGRRLWIDTSKSPLSGADDRPFGVLGVYEDITERKLTSDVLRQNDARMQSLLRILQYRYSSINDLLDYTLNEVIALTASKIGYLYHYDENKQEFTLNTWSKEVMAACSIIEYQTTYALDKTGLWGEAVRQRRPIVVNNFHAANPLKKGYPEEHAPLHSFLTIPVFNGDAIVAVIGVANKEADYTEADVQQLTLMMEAVWKMAERARADQALRAAESRYRNLLESIQLLATIIDVQGNITFCNDHFLKVTGYTRDEIIGCHALTTLIPQEEQERVKEVYQSVIADKVERHLENRIVSKNGEQRLIVWDRAPLLDTNGNVTGIASIGSDITEHRSTEEQLRQSQKMEAVGQLAGGVAHDFNNILSVISGYCGLLMHDGKLDGEQMEFLEQISHSSEKAAQLTHGLLAFSRKQALLFQHENLNDIVLHVHKFLARIIGEDVKLYTTCSGAQLPVSVDKGQIEQVLINLATNARDAMPNGGTFSIRTDVTVHDNSFTMEVNEPVPPGKYAVIIASDTGIGISHENIEHIFEPFFTTKEMGKGTGLGMAIIYGIIKQHRGFINVCSEVGQGTTFRIYLPFAEQYNDLRDRAEMIEPLTGNNETILVAEDESSVRFLIEKVLTKYGYKVILAEDGQDVIEKFVAHQNEVSLILMDVIMPKKNGREAYSEINRIHPDMKVLYSSGYTADFIKDRGVSEEDIELIMKPVQPLHLLRKIRQLLDC